MKKIIAVALALFAGPSFAHQHFGAAGATAGGQEHKSRPFYMGVSLMPHDLSLEGMAALFAFLNTNVDIVPLVQDKGVPWPEALEKRAYSAEFEKKLSEEQEQFKDRKLFLAAT